MTLLGAPVGLLGVVALGAGTFALTLWATLEPPKQGLVLTGMILGTFVLAMMLVPKARRSLSALAASPAAAADATA